MRTTLTLAALCLPFTCALAQLPAAPVTPRNESAHYSDAQIRDMLQKAPASFSTRLFRDTTHSTALIRLDKPDSPHAHGAWSEVFIIKEGAGVLETNGTITGVTGADGATHKDMFVSNDVKAAASQPATPARKRAPAPGDLAGTNIEGGLRQNVKAGDVILIPAGVPHRWLQVDLPVVYLDIKFPKAE
jgi:mannose-6-phosphate isomerase-like protein (cupin superfamily)